MDALISGFWLIFQPDTLFYIACGTTMGVVLGAMPGISTSMAIVLCMTFTYAMNPIQSICFLVSVYCASNTGGGITAILFNIPGNPQSAPTTFDGYPMALKGEGGKALTYTIIASAVGGTVSAIAMLLLSPQLTTAALKFGPSELFAITFLGLSVLTCLDSGKMTQTIISGLMGLLLATVGSDPIMGFPRFTWGNSTLLSGINLIPVMIGMFAAAEVFKMTVSYKKIDTEALDLKKTKAEFVSPKEMLSHKGAFFRGSLVGTLIGILPGAGATVASFLAYTAEVKSSKNPESFGKGNPKGVIASESASNASAGGAMVPLLSLGLPGGNAAAVIMAALVLKGVQMGPMLLRRQPEYLYTVFASIMFTNIFMIIVAVFIAKIFAKILDIPYHVLGTIILMLAAIGSFALARSTGDVMLMVISGIFGYAFIKNGFNVAALVLGLVLGEICESNLRRAVSLANGDYMAILSRPITGILLLICVIMLLTPVVMPLIKKAIAKNSA